MGVVVVIIGFVYWASTQPTEFDGFLRAQKDFIDDVYSGNLLADVSQVLSGRCQYLVAISMIDYG